MAFLKNKILEDDFVEAQTSVDQNFEELEKLGVIKMVKNFTKKCTKKLLLAVFQFCF